MMGLSPRATIAFSVAVTFSIVGTFFLYAMLGQVNARLPENERISYLGFHFVKNRRIATLYKQFFPDGRLLWAYRSCVFGAIVSMFMVVLLDQ